MSGRNETRKRSKISPDVVLKNYWNGDGEFADLFNAVLFDGEEIIRPEELSVDDTDSSVLQEYHKSAESISGARDTIKICRKSTPFGVNFAILGLEHQEKVHYAMPMRVMGYDYSVYKKQYDANVRKFKKRKKSKKKTKSKPMTGAELLSGMMQTDKLSPVVTIVIYYGEEPWDGATSLCEMLDIPGELKHFVNDYKMILVEARKNDLVFHNVNNRDLFCLFEIVLNKNLSHQDKTEQFTRYCKEHQTDRDVLITLAGATNTKLDYNTLSAGVEGDFMCSFFDELAREGREKGLKEGREEGCGRVNALNRKLSELGRMEDIIRAAGDQGYQKSLFLEFGL